MESEEKKDSVEVQESTKEVMQEVKAPVENQPLVEEKHEVVDKQIGEEKVAEKKKKKRKGPLIVLLLLILLVGLGCAYYYLFMNKEVETKTVKKKAKEVKSEYRMSGNSLEEFDLYFLKLENEEKNKVYSPLSIKYALEMLSEGANGETKSQLDAVIGDYKAKKYPNNEHMSFANAMFIRDTFKSNIKDDYTKKLMEKYNAEVINDPFENPNNINNWVSNKTFNLINNLVDDVNNNDYFLINALAIDMNWNNQIHCEANHKIPCIGDGTYSISYAHEKLGDDDNGYSVIEYPYSSEEEFYGNKYKGEKNIFNDKENTKGGTVLADFNKYDIVKDLGEDKIKEIIKPEYEEWLQTEYGKNDKPFDEFIGTFIQELKDNYGKSANSTDFFVYEDDNIKEFAKDLQTYDNTTLQYIGIMPKKDQLTDFIKNTDKDQINKIINSLKEVKIDSFEEGYATRIRGFIPFFKFEYNLKLQEDLERLGIKDVFDENKADLSKLSNKEGTYINKALHKANIEFSNDGIKASAATAFGGYGAASGPQFEHLFKVPVKEIDMTFDNPYMYIIRDKASGEVWFAGTVYEPIHR